MIIRSLLLNPFAGIAGRTVHFHAGLNVVCGPNEAGKSTISRAILLTLFLPTNLSPKKLVEAIARYLPRPQGDTVHTELVLEQGGQVITISKTWGPQGATRLTMPDGNILTDPAKAQAAILALLGVNETVVKRVLVANQSELRHAIADFEDNTEVRHSLTDMLRGSVLQDEGISPEALLDAVNRKVDHCFSRWDAARQRQEGNRDYTNPWQKEVGDILAAFYAQQRAEALLAEVSGYETEMARLEQRAKKTADQLAAADEFVGQNKKAFDDAQLRKELDYQLEKVCSALEALNQSILRWPEAEKSMAREELAIEQILKSLNELEEELATATQQKEGQQKKAKLDLAKTVRAELEAATGKAQEQQAVADADIAAAEGHTSTAHRCAVKLEAQALKGTIASTSAQVISVRSGLKEQETLSLGAGAVLALDGNGSIEIVAGDFTIQVSSAKADVAALQLEYEAATAALAKHLDAFCCKNLTDLKTRKALYEQARTEVKQLSARLADILGGQEYDTLEEECQTLGSLPQTRAAETLSAKKSAELKACGAANANLLSLKGELEQLAAKYGSEGIAREAKFRGDKKKAELEEALASLSPLPGGFDNIDAFTSRYNDQLNMQLKLTQELAAMQQEQSRLLAPEATLAEARDAAALASHTFTQRNAEGTAWKHIQRVLQSIIRDTDGDIYEPLHGAARRYISRLTEGKYHTLPMQGVQPRGVESHQHKELSLDLLSKGTSDCVALALRLAAADFYLKDAEGFLIMDDPFVDMDKTRQAAAAAVLKEFATHKQTIVFTCHEGHAALLKEDWAVMEALG